MSRDLIFPGNRDLVIIQVIPVHNSCAGIPGDHINILPDVSVGGMLLALEGGGTAPPYLRASNIPPP